MTGFGGGFANINTLVGWKHFNLLLLLVSFVFDTKNTTAHTNWSSLWYNWNIVESGVKHHNPPNLYVIFPYLKLVLQPELDSNHRQMMLHVVRTSRILLTTPITDKIINIIMLPVLMTTRILLTTAITDKVMLPVVKLLYKFQRKKNKRSPKLDTLY
jgi:hypothetical protein